MGRFRDTFLGFDHNEYYAKLIPMGEKQLRHEHNIIRRRVIGAGTQATLGVGAALATSGVSIVVGGIGARRTSVNRQKRKLIEQRMRSMNWQIDDLEFKDIIIGAGPGLIAAAVAPGAEHVIGHFAGHGASEMVSQYAPETLRAAVETPVHFAHFAEYGVRQQIEAVTQGAVGNASHFIPHTGAEYLASATGYAGASMAEAKAAEHAAEAVSGYGLKKWGTSSCGDALAAKPASEKRPTYIVKGQRSNIANAKLRESVASGSMPSVNATETRNSTAPSEEVFGLDLYYILICFPIIGNLFGLAWIWTACVAWLALAILKPSETNPPPWTANLIWLIPGLISSLAGLKGLWLATSFVIACIGLSQFSSTSAERPRVSTTISFMIFSAAAGFEDNALKELLWQLFIMAASFTWILISVSKVRQNISLMIRAFWAMLFFAACVVVLAEGAVVADLVF